MAKMIMTFAQKGLEKKAIGSETIDSLTKRAFTTPFVANSDLKTMEYATNEVTAGKKMIVRNRPFSFRVF